MSTLSTPFSTTLAIAALLVLPTGSVRAAGASATISAYPCSTVDPELYTHQRWIAGATPYGIAIEQWDQAAFDALKQRMTSCITPSNRPRTLMMLRYLEGPYGPQAQVLRQIDTSNTKAAQKGAFVDEIRSEMASAAADATPKGRRIRLATISTKIDLSILPADQKLDLRRQLIERIKEAAERDAADAAAAEDVARQERAAEAEAAEAEKVADEKQATQQQAEDSRRQLEEQIRAKAAATEAARKATQQQAEAERAQLKAQAQAKAAAAEAETYYQQRLPKLNPDLITFLTKNPRLKPQQAAPSLKASLAIVDTMALALDVCHENLDGFGAEWTEMQRRLGLLQQLLISYDDVTPAEIAQGSRDRRTRLDNNSFKEQLLGDVAYMRKTCSEAMTISTNLFDFSR